MSLRQKVKSALAALSAPEWVSNLVALAALVTSLYSVKVSRDIAREQVERDEATKAMQYTIAV